MSTLTGRFEAHWRASGWPTAGERVGVACSGGLDSLVLLHLLKFSAAGLNVRPVALHFDHGMRAESRADSEWLRGLAAAWGVSLRVGRAPAGPKNEGEARALRYEFLETSVRTGEMACILTAHHADDQAETILLRVLRGTGLDGLRGIPDAREPGLVRPLLPFRRSELEAYAREHGLRERLDPTNYSDRFARNRVRHGLLPILEGVHPGARESLLRLGRNAGRTLEALAVLLDPHWTEVAEETGSDDLLLRRGPLTEKPDAVVGALIRRATQALGVTLNEVGTGSAVEFIRASTSGARLDLPGPLQLTREFERFRLSHAANPSTDPADLSAGQDRLEIGGPEQGEGEICLSGKRFRVAWGPASTSPVAPDDWQWAVFRPTELAFPLCVRGWRPGDRIRLGKGRKKLKKVFRERRVPVSERDRLPVFVDSDELIVWCPGVGVGIGTRQGFEKGWHLGLARPGSD